MEIIDPSVGEHLISSYSAWTTVYITDSTTARNHEAVDVYVHA